MTREEWLNQLVETLRPKYGNELPETVRVSVGFPSSGRKSRTVGECWHKEASEDGNVQVFVHPRISDAVEVAAIIVHELVHACRPDAKHGTMFKQLAVDLGLEGKMTATVASERLRKELADIVADLGPYPHAALVAGSGPKQSTRMLKLQCPHCDYIVRTTAKWLEVGLPLCPDGNTMLPEGMDSE